MGFNNKNWEDIELGILIAKSRPINVTDQNQFKGAHHTYVECGTGKKGWACWGGKTGGSFLTQGKGSTLRADKIAEPNERANIKVYLVNGVCHQAANRILFPAKELVTRCIGYSLSESLYGPYGRPYLIAPFNQHRNESGDLRECTQRSLVAKVAKETTDDEGLLSPQNGSQIALSRDEQIALPQRDATIRQNENPTYLEVNKGLSTYINRVIRIYDGLEREKNVKKSLSISTLINFSTSLFELMLEYRFKNSRLSRPEILDLLRVRNSFEESRINLDKSYLAQEMHVFEFADRFNELTIDFQWQIANTINPEKYITLFNTSPDEPIILADEEIIKEQ